MKNYLPLLILLILFSACKKDQVATGDFRLTRITYPVNGEGKDDFAYDGSGGITQKTYTPTNGPTTIYYALSYSGNEVVISYPADPSPTIQRETRYQLDAQGRPMKRIYSELQTFPRLPTSPERHFISESTDYEYDATGYMTKYTGVSADSISYYVDVNTLHTSNDKMAYSVIYEMDGGNLKSVKKTLQENYDMLQQPGGTYGYQKNIEETTIFTYDKKFPNRFDFKNAFLIKEMDILPFSNYFPNEKYLNYPNKAVTTTITKDGNGVVLSTEVTSEEPPLGFNTDGYLLTKNSNQNEKQVFVYNKVK